MVVGVLGRLVVGGYLCTLELVSCWLVLGRFVVTCMPWSLCLGGWCWLEVVTCTPWSLCLAGSCPWLVWLPACLEPRALLVRVLVGGGYLHALNLVSLVCALVVGWWLEVVTCMPWSLCLGACALVVRAWWWLPAYLGGSCLGGGYLHALVVGRLVVGVSLCALAVGRLVVCPWLVCLEVVTCMPWWFVPWLVCS